MESIQNFLTFDIEEWYHANYEGLDPVTQPQETHLEALVERLIDLCAERGVRTTCFVLGSVAEAKPGIVKKLHRAGHEIASHGYGHELVYPMGPARFAGDLRVSCDILEALTGAPRAVMMLASDQLRVVPLTIHTPLSLVPAAITSAAIVETGEIILASLKKYFDIAVPRLAVSGLNPHAGEDGELGREETNLIAPAVAALKARGHDVRGPLPADTMFHAEARAAFDAALCMYHDQALIPIKTLSFWDGVNVTLGLPIIRTSPDHGTAFDIAGAGKADPRSMIAAIRMAASMADAPA